ncbi:hypothetical protein TNCV_1755921 [Trichonephila clavipes]|nr:hypothetical protein TNCV_1755921 [Trichonephila clavipes]
MEAIRLRSPDLRYTRCWQEAPQVTVAVSQKGSPQTGSDKRCLSWNTRFGLQEDQFHLFCRMDYLKGHFRELFRAGVDGTRDWNFKQRCLGRDNENESENGIFRDIGMR